MLCESSPDQLAHYNVSIQDMSSYLKLCYKVIA